MDYKVKVSYLRIGHRKVSRLFPFIKGNYVNQALANLAIHPQQSSKVLIKAIKSGIANALFQSKRINPDTLWVKNAMADGAPHLKRIRAGSRGSADPILKRSSHITVILTDDRMPEKAKRVKAGGAKKVDATPDKVQVEG